MRTRCTAAATRWLVSVLAMAALPCAAVTGDTTAAPAGNAVARERLDIEWAREESRR